MTRHSASQDKYLACPPSMTQFPADENCQSESRPVCSRAVAGAYTGSGQRNYGQKWHRVIGTETGDNSGAHETRHGTLALMVETGTALDVDTAHWHRWTLAGC